MEKIIGIYHSVDQDGWFSAAILLKSLMQKYPTGLEIIDLDDAEKSVEASGKTECKLILMGWNYGQDELILDGYDKVYMMDVSWSNQNMIKLSMKYKENFVWIDHHKTSIHRMKFLKINGIQDMRMSAAELTWEWFFHTKDLPEIVRQVSLYDTFNHKALPTEEKTRINIIHYGLNDKVICASEAFDYLDLEQFLGSTEVCNDLFEIGLPIYERAKARCIRQLEEGIITTLPEKLGSKKALLVNSWGPNPGGFDIQYKDFGAELLMRFVYEGINKWKFSMRANDDVDVSLIAACFEGGGGHAGAAGFECSTEEMVEIIKE